MAKQTHSSRTWVPTGSRVRWRGDPTRAAELGAPTAPHAGPVAPDTPASGPARFWSTRRFRIAFLVALGMSTIAHWFVAPWRLLSPSSGIELKDPGGELAIPIDIMGEEPPPPPPPPAPPTPVAPDPTHAEDDPNAPGRRDAGPIPIKKDAGLQLSTLDAGAEGLDGGAITDAGLEGADGGPSDAGFYALYDGDGGTPGANGPRDPEAMFGLTKVVNAGVQNIVLGVNTALIRQHPVGGRLGPVLMALPQWSDFFKGSTSQFEPVRDSDWLLLYGPSLRHTDKTAMIVRYNVSDALVAKSIGDIAKTYDKGGPYDAGVPGVKGSIGFADNATRAFLQPQSHLLVIVPPTHGHEAALTFKKQTPRGPHPQEAMRLIVKNPSNQVSIRGLKFATSLTEIRLWIIPRDNGDADVYAEGDNTDEEAAKDTAAALTKLIADQNAFGVRMATHGLLNNARVVPDGKKITLHILATRDQLEAILQLLAMRLNVNLPPPPAPPGSGSAVAPFTRPQE